MTAATILGLAPYIAVMYVTTIVVIVYGRTTRLRMDKECEIARSLRGTSTRADIVIRSESSERVRLDLPMLSVLPEHEIQTPHP